MKRILLGALTLIATFAAVTPAQAGRTFGLFVGCHLFRCNSCCEFCVRPYNAFSPVCSGSITCDGVMPFASGMPGLNYSGYGSGCCQGGMCGPAGFDGGSYADMSQGAGYPALAAPMQPQMPASTPVLMPPGTGAARPNYAGYGVQPVGYYPNYGYGYPAAMPAYPMNYYGYPMQQMPYYWNPMGGR